MSVKQDRLLKSEHPRYFAQQLPPAQVHSSGGQQQSVAVQSHSPTGHVHALQAHPESNAQQEALLSEAALLRDDRPINVDTIPEAAKTLSFINITIILSES